MIININKPVDWSSFDVVKKIKNITKHKKVGHGGTLDPFASGVLIIGTEKDTRSLSSITNSDKTYEAEIELGKVTNTLDTEGEVVREMPIPMMESKNIESTLHSFMGKQKQMPPMFSAKKHNGIRLYKLARMGKEIDREDIDIFISDIRLIDFNRNSIKFSVECSKGTYVRVLGKDIAERLGTVGYLTELTRTKVGDHLIDDSLSIELFQNKWKSTEQ
ncbi:MAG: tRNA pseudouridine(55) synthase TruB [Candidatus Neomarinimicrobiota bacterium]|nr:tRNA pseudouridine(55) synthase TruB [Candidatus Neomarinimicrobiota bacterium]MED5553498.1 tRNA pseudouridine(55) synthase TruB [Candidatus Neomarinimicrobiota bacterium]